MRLSIVIPCLNEEKNIGKLIKVLKNQNFPRSEFEIITVDNASEDNTSKAAKEAGADKIILEKNKGTNFARQAGFAISKGEIVVFLDADCLPPKDWLKKIWAIFKSDEKKEIGILSGPCRYHDLGFVMRLVTDLCQKAMILIIVAGNFILKRKWAIALGGNMAIRRIALESIGGMDTKFTFFGDDSDTAFRIRRAGYEAKFDRTITVNSSARRLKKKGFIRTAIFYVAAYIKLCLGSTNPLNVDEKTHKVKLSELTPVISSFHRFIWSEAFPKQKILRICPRVLCSKFSTKGNKKRKSLYKNADVA